MLAGFFLHLVWLLFWGPREIDMDGAEYARLAQNLLHGAGYVGMFGRIDFSFPPLYPLLIVIATPLARNPEAAGMLVAFIAGTLLVIPVFAIATRLYGSEAGFWGALLVALCPFVSILATTVLTDATFLLLAFGGLYFWLRASRSGEIRDEAACGLCFGVAALARPEGLLLAVAAIAFCSARRVFERRGRAALQAMAAIGLPFALCIAPYVYEQSHAAGHLRFEGKTAVNYAIGQRIVAGMSYIEAADGLDAQAQPIGAELTGLLPASAPHAGLNKPYLGFLAHNATHHLRDVAALLLRSLPYDFGLLALLGLVGLAGGPWSKGRAWDEAALICFALTIYVSLTSVAHFWDRYDDTFIPLLAVWGGKGISDLLARARRFRTAGTALTVAVLCVLFVASGVKSPARDVAKKDAGLWLTSQQPRAAIVMESSDLAAFYAGANWRSLPYASTPLALRYIASVAPNYVILESDATEKLPYMADWLAHGVPDARAILVHVVTSGMTKIAVYRWNPSRLSLLTQR